MRNLSRTIIARLLMITPVTLSVVLLAGGCGGSSPTAPDSGGPAQNGTLTLMMVDAPTDEICELWVFIENLRVKPDGQPPEILGNEAIGLVELLELRDGPAALLGKYGVATGRYQFIEMLLDEDQSFVVETDSAGPSGAGCAAEPSPLQIPSEKFKINGGPFDVTQNTTVTIDFDAEKSLKRKGSASNPKGWKLKPDVSIIEVE